MSVSWNGKSHYNCRYCLILYDLMSENYNNTQRTLNIVDADIKCIHDISKIIFKQEITFATTQMETNKTPTRPCAFRRHVSDSLIMLIAPRVAFKCVTCGCFWISLEKKIAPASCSCVAHFQQKPAEAARADVRRRVLRSSISTMWWVYASSLPGGAPWATTSHLSPYAFSHFTFIRTGNDFPPMKAREEHNESLVGERWNLHPATAIGPTFIKCYKGNI